MRTGTIPSRTVILPIEIKTGYDFTLKDLDVVYSLISRGLGSGDSIIWIKMRKLSSKTILTDDLRPQESEIKEALRSPIEVRKSKKDPSVYLYYHLFGNKFITVVTKHLNGEGFIITDYLTRRISSVGSEKVYE